jgi:hypothetical protein
MVPPLSLQLWMSLLWYTNEPARQGCSRCVAWCARDMRHLLVLCPCTLLGNTSIFRVWCCLQSIQLCDAAQDKFIWMWTPDQQYSASSAYRAFFHCQSGAFFHCQSGIPGARQLSKTKAIPRCKFFLRLALMGRCWALERLHRHQLQNNGSCALHSQSEESIHHLLLTCVFSPEVWFRVLRWTTFITSRPRRTSP